MMHNARRWILQGKDLYLAGRVAGLQVREPKGVVAGLDANDVMRARTQVAEVGGVGAEGVFDDDDRQVGMLLAKPAVVMRGDGRVRAMRRKGGQPSAAPPSFVALRPVRTLFP